MDFDVYIQKKDKSLPAHKAIMSLNTVFTEIMKSTAENESVICLDKYDSADVEILLFYIHTDQVLTEAASISLLQLASKFQQTNLASLCTNALEADGRIYGDQVLEFAGEFIHHDISNPHTRPPTSRLLVHLASFPLSALCEFPASSSPSTSETLFTYTQVHVSPSPPQPRPALIALKNL